MAEAVTVAINGVRTTAESVAFSLTDSISKAAVKFPLESVVPSDVLGRVFTGFRTLAEAPTFSDAASRVFTGFRATSDSLASVISDVVNKGVAKSLSGVIGRAEWRGNSAGEFTWKSMVT